MLRFEDPWLLSFALMLPLLVWFRLRGKPPAIRYSSGAIAGSIKPTWRVRMLGFPGFLRCAAMACLVVAFARPQRGTEVMSESRRGVAIEVILDRSGSMQAPMAYDGSEVTRLEAAKRVLQEFVNGGRGLPGRPNDLIGVVTFARFADTVCPLTLAHDALGRLVEGVTPAENKSEDGTAIGDAIALAAARLKTAEEALLRQDETRRHYEIKSKLIILLTDGQHNAGKRLPEEAAAQAKEWGIKIYTIGIGDDQSFVQRNGLFGPLVIPMGGEVDKRMLQGLAKGTNGIFRMAKDAPALREIYKEIDRLEQSDFSALRFVDYRELFAHWTLAALLLLGLEVVVSSTILRTVP